MKRTMKQTLLVLLAFSLFLALTLGFSACGEDAPTDAPTEAPTLSSDVPTAGETDAPTEEVLTGIWKNALYKEDVTLGEGAKTVQVEVVADGHSITVTVKTDEEVLGHALLSLGLIEGDMGDYGLYVKRVNGIKADYDVDQTYWGFYKNGEYMMTGVDQTKIKGGEHFELVKTK